MSVPKAAPNPRALVTGATRGIGRGIARRLAADGFDLLLAARDRAALDSTAAELAGTGVEVATQETDLSDPEQVESLAHVQQQLGDRLDVLVLAAGVGAAGAVDSYPMRLFDLQIAVNLRAPFQLVQLLLPSLRRAAESRPRTGAKIIAVASISGVAAEPDLAAYGATKAALISFCESITAGESSAGVTATAVSPGFVDTDMSRWVYQRLQPEEMISVEDVAEMARAVWRLGRYAAVPNIVITRPGSPLWRA